MPEQPALTAPPTGDAWLDDIRWNADGLVPAIAQDAGSGQVLTLAWMNREALARTRDSGEVHYWSRSRARLWKKGESSGHVQRVRELRIDCDADAVLVRVEQVGGIACHTGHARCFFRALEGDAWQESDPVLKAPEAIYGKDATPAEGQLPARAAPPSPHDERVLARVAATVASRRGADPKSSYVASLFAKGDDAILKKIGEEATETVLAAKEGSAPRIVAEVADLWFHCIVLLARHGLAPADVAAELARREGVSGHDEKASRG